MPPEPKQEKTITNQQLYNRLQGRGGQTMVLDLRAATDFEKAHVSTAFNVPYEDVMQGGGAFTVAAIEKCFTSSVALSKFRNRHEIKVLIMDSESPARAELLAVFLRTTEPTCYAVPHDAGVDAFVEQYPFLCTGSSLPEVPSRHTMEYYPSEVLPDFLFLGDQHNSSNRRQFEQLGIRRVVNCAKEMSNPFEDMCQYVRLNLDDTLSQPLRPVLEQACDFLAEAERQNEKTLVHCAFGQSRSASTVLAYLIKSRRLPLETALRQLKACKEDINPNQHFLEELAKWEHSILR